MKSELVDVFLSLVLALTITFMIVLAVQHG